MQIVPVTLGWKGNNEIDTVLRMEFIVIISMISLSTLPNGSQYVYK